MHTEDEERFLQMQKLQINMHPCQTQMAKKIVGIEYRMILKKGPINKTMGLNRLLTGIGQLKIWTGSC